MSAVGNICYIVGEHGDNEVPLGPALGRNVPLRFRPRLSPFNGSRSCRDLQ
jgi:hypothetical protein